MSATVRSRLIRIGNSQGVRIPKIWLEQSNLREEVELVLQRDYIVVRPIHRPRRRRDEAFRAMAEQGDDALLDGDVRLTNWDEQEWVW